MSFIELSGVTLASRCGVIERVLFQTFQSDLAALGLALELSDEHLTCLRTLG